MREFDRREALLAAVGVFWRHGYAKASIHELTGAMGLHRAQIYQAFGSKEELFAEVVRTYSNLAFETVFAPLEDRRVTSDGASALAAIEECLERLAQSVEDPERPGCLVESSLLTPANELGVAHRACLEHLARMEAGLRRVLETGRERGEISSEPSLDEQVAVVRGAMMGMACVQLVDRRTGGPRAVRRALLNFLRSQPERQPEESSTSNQGS